MNKQKQYLVILVLLLFSTSMQSDYADAANYIDSVNANTEVTISIVEASESEIDGGISDNQENINENTKSSPKFNLPQTGERRTQVWFRILIGSCICLFAKAFQSKFGKKKILGEINQ